jgi:hypothetical protein
MFGSAIKQLHKLLDNRLNVAGYKIVRISHLKTLAFRESSRLFPSFAASFAPATIKQNTSKKAFKHWDNSLGGSVYGI